MLGRTAIAVLLATLLGGGSISAAAEQRAGVIVSFGDGRVVSTCVDLGADGEATGEEMLRATGLDLTIEYGGVGGALCKVADTGCAFPTDSCFCQCTLRPGEPCRYWSYAKLANGAWSYSKAGMGSTVRAGAVEGWTWGEGTVAQGALPPVTPSFAQVCSAPTPSPQPSATDTSDLPVVVAGPTQPPTATIQPTPSAGPVTPSPVVGGDIPNLPPTPVVYPSATPRQLATPAPTQPPPIPTAVGEGQPAPPSPIPTAVGEGTPVPTAPAVAIAATPQREPGGVPAQGLASETPLASPAAAVASPYPVPPGAAPPYPAPPPAVTVPAARAPQGLPAVTPLIAGRAQGAPPQPPEEDRGYIVFAVLAGLLLAGNLWLRRRATADR